MTSDQSTHDRDRTTDRLESAIDRRTFIAAGGTVGATMLAGCASEGSPTDDSSDDPSDDEGTTEEAADVSTTDGANFRLLISDRPADIGDFDRLDVTFDSARIFDGGGEESGDDEGGEGDDGEDGSDGDGEDGDESAPEAEEEGDDTTTENEETATDDEEDETGEGDESDDESDGDDSEASDESDGEGVERRRGFYWLDLEGATVDLTQVVGDRAISVFEGGLSEGTYQKIELHVAEVEGVVDGDVVDVKVPSEKLQITHSFEVSADEPLEFVFDINVVKRGPNNGYILKPVISESGVAGKDVDVEEVGDDESEDGEDGSDGNGPENDGDGGDADGDSDADAGDANESDANA